MKKLLLLLILLISQLINGQSYFNEIKNFVSQLEIADSLKHKLKNNDFKELEILDVFYELKRKIDFEYSQHRILILHFSGGDLQLDLLSKDDKIIIGWISTLDSNDEYLKIEYFKSDEAILEYLNKHNKFYDTDYDITDFREQLLAKYTVGYGCGIAGDHIPKEVKKAERWYKLRRKKKLRKYLTSINPEKQTLGAIGILKFNRQNEFEKKIINHLKNRNSMINSCSGCIYGIEKSFQEIIEHYE